MRSIVSFFSLVVLIVLIVNPAFAITEERADCLFDVFENKYFDTFQERGTTEIELMEGEPAYYREYINDTGLGIFINTLYYKLDGTWYEYGNIDEADMTLTGNWVFLHNASKR